MTPASPADRVPPPAEPTAGNESFVVGAGIDFTDPNSPLAKYYFQTSHILFAAFLGLIFVVATAFPLWHTDVWGHVRYGQWMAENRAIPDREPFCPWWDGRQPFTQFYTLSQLAMYFAYAGGDWLAGGDDLRRMAGGVEMLRGQHALLTAARFALLLAVFVRLGRDRQVALFGVVAVVLLDLSNLAVFRPQTFAQTLFAALLLPMSRTILSRRAIVLIPLLLVVWANTHGSFIVALAFLGVLLAGRVAELALAGEWRPRRWLADVPTRRLAAALAQSFVAIAVLNPYGPDLYKRTMDLSKHPSLITAVGEWQPLGFVWTQGWHWIFMASLLVIAATQLAAKTTMKPAHLLALGVFGVGVALQNRFVIWWAMVVPWVLVPQWAEIASRFPAVRIPEGVPSFRKTILAAIVGIAFVAWSGPAGWLIAGEPMPFANAVSSGTPWKVARSVTGKADGHAELDTALADYFPGKQFRGTILATPMQGDYLMWAVAPQIPVTYAHIHLFPHDFWEELGIVGQGRPGWYDVLDKYRVNLLVVEAEYAPKLREELLKSKQWKILLDETGDIERKPEKLNRQLIVVRVRPL